MDPPQEKEKVESKANRTEINEKAKNKLKEYSELKCLYHLSNGGVRYKRDISLIIRERIEKNLNKNQGKNNYYTEKNPSSDVFNLKNLIQSLFGDYIQKNNIDVKTEVTKMEAELEEKRQQMGKNKAYVSNKQKKNIAKKKEKEQVNNNNNENGSDIKRNRRNYALYVINDKRKKKSSEQNDKLKPEVSNNNNKNYKRKPLLIEKKEKEKEENENKKIEEENNNNNNNKENNNITESEKSESNNDNKNIIEKEKENERIIKRDNNKKDTNKEEINEDNIKETITDIIKKTINKKKTREKKEDNNDKINKTMNSASCKDIRIKIPKINKDKLKLNFNFINSIQNNFKESRNNDDKYITTEHRSFARPKNFMKKVNNINNINSPIKKMIENETRKYNSYRKKRDIISDLPIKNIIENENEAKKYYTYRKKNNNDDLIDQPMEEKKGRLQNYRNRSKSNKKTEKKEKVIINIPEDIIKSRSVKKSKLKKQKKHHRHHHFYHFKKPQRIVAISNIDSFSIMNFNS